MRMRGLEHDAGEVTKVIMGVTKHDACSGAQDAWCASVH